MCFDLISTSNRKFLFQRKKQKSDSKSVLRRSQKIKLLFRFSDLVKITELNEMHRMCYRFLDTDSNNITLVIGTLLCRKIGRNGWKVLTKQQTFSLN